MANCQRVFWHLHRCSSLFIHSRWLVSKYGHIMTYHDISKNTPYSMSHSPVISLLRSILSGISFPGYFHMVCIITDISCHTMIYPKKRYVVIMYFMTCHDISKKTPWYPGVSFASPIAELFFQATSLRSTHAQWRWRHSQQPNPISSVRFHRTQP